jgi:hypothetical protein
MVTVAMVKKIDMCHKATEAVRKAPEDLGTQSPTGPAVKSATGLKTAVPTHLQQKPHL